jgi:hypothetical protein|tara:strand:+ start:1150 stop:1524 length:375 start_codon:yes stop_codon:yes gene_type:complete
MKINELTEGTFDDFGLKGHGSELDKDNDAPGFKQAAMFDQLGKILDSQNSPKPVKSVKTDDGKEINVTAQQARMLRMFATTDKVKPNVRTRFIQDIQKSSGLHDFVDIKDYHEMPKLFMQKYLG